MSDKLFYESQNECFMGFSPVIQSWTFRGAAEVKGSSTASGSIITAIPSSTVLPSLFK